MCIHSAVFGEVKLKHSVQTRLKVITSLLVFCLGLSAQKSVHSLVLLLSELIFLNTARMKQQKLSSWSVTLRNVFRIHNITVCLSVRLQFCLSNMVVPFHQPLPIFLIKSHSSLTINQYKYVL